MGKRKSFIDKNSATTYRLVHRSQRDPLIADNDAGQHVLQKVSTKEAEERTKYGIYYTDGYDYLKHLKVVGESVDLGGEEVERSVISVPKKQLLPDVIFETKGVELKVGLLNQAAPRNELLPDIDPDIAAALDGDLNDDDEEGQLDDDFVIKANADGDGSAMLPERVSTKVGRSEMLERFGLVREEKFSDESSDDDDDNDDEMDKGGENDRVSRSNYYDDDDKEERRSRFTNYSMSSAVIKRPDGLQIIDEHFEALYEQYDDEKCGQIEDEGEEIAGHMDPSDERFTQLVEEYSSTKRKFIPERPTADIKERVLKIAAEAGLVDDEELVDSDDEDDDEYSKKPRWDCESIVSTYSHTKNHPAMIKDECAFVKSNRRKAHRQPSKPLDDLDEEKMDDMASVISTVSTIRVKGETPEERRLRKQAVREQRRERRVEKKSTKLAFKDQKKEFDRQRASRRVDIRPIN